MVAALFDTGSSAALSADRLYRYELTRMWGAEPHATFVMLNPSTADADVDDPTIRRCIGFARSWGCGGLVVVNLYALRATQPADLWRAADPVGPDNDEHLSLALYLARGSTGPVVAAWGAHAKPDRVRFLTDAARDHGVQLLALKVTKAGAPGHPLYLRADAEPMPWGGA
jgi:hypothetical protein